MKIKEFVAELNKPGKIYAPVLMNGEIAHIAVNKSDMIDYLLSNNDADQESPWDFYGAYHGGRKIDVAG
jgi:hypothetical protein